ncbi:MAG TPA: hypothetical protein DEB06_07495 [Phycisphaerales bacterium]|nr:hypothetical protein [Phycisphaerales bacterium]
MVLAAALVCAGVAVLFLGWTRRPSNAPLAGVEPVVRAELRSWVVAGRGRHLFLQIDAPSPHDALDGRVEFTSLALRRGYRARDDSTGMPRVGRMTPGEVLRPVLGRAPDNRLEAVYTLSLGQAECLTRDRVFSAPYVLLGANSNAALRRTMESCGVGVPARVLRGAGPLGEFPGIDQDPGPEVPSDQWPALGLAARAR